MPPSEGKLRVLVYADSAVFSGAESLLCDLVETWHEEGRFHLSVSTSVRNAELSDRLGRVAEPGDRFPVPAQRLPLAALNLYSPWRVKAVREAIISSRPDVVMLNLPSAEYGATPLLVTRRLGVPVVGLMHISGTMDRLGFRLGSIRTALARRAVSRLDRVLLLSDSAWRTYADLWNPESTTAEVIRLPAPKVTSTDSASARDRLGLPAEKKLVGIIGRISVKQKGHDTFVQAARLLAESRDDLEFVVVGDGRDREPVKDLVAEAGLRDQFHFTGQVSDVGVALSALDAIAMPSRFEGLPLTALEALSAGVPGVVSAVDGLCDVWPAEWRVQPDDPDGLADSLARLIDGGPGAGEELVALGRQMMKNRTSDDAADQVAESLEAVGRNAQI